MILIIPTLLGLHILINKHFCMTVNLQDLHNGVKLVNETGALKYSDQ